MPGKRDRIIWAVVLAETHGFSLLYVKKPGQGWPDMLTVAVENREEGFYAELDGCGFQFPLRKGVLRSISERLRSLEDGSAQPDVDEPLKPEDLF